MSNYTVEEVEKEADFFDSMTFHKAAEMIRELAHRLRQEEEENKRDPVTEPKIGDAVWFGDHMAFIYHGVGYEEAWKAFCMSKGATIIRRREVPQ